MKKIINEELITQECKFLKNKSSKIIWSITLLAIVSYLAIILDNIEVIAITIPVSLLCLAEYFLTKNRLNNIELILISRVDYKDDKI